jgi:hypothetical protein
MNHAYTLKGFVKSKFRQLFKLMRFEIAQSLLPHACQFPKKRSVSLSGYNFFSFKKTKMMKHNVIVQACYVGDASNI